MAPERKDQKTAVIEAIHSFLEKGADRSKTANTSEKPREESVAIRALKNERRLTPEKLDRAASV